MAGIAYTNGELATNGALVTDGKGWIIRKFDQLYLLPSVGNGRSEEMFIGEKLRECLHDQFILLVYLYKNKIISGWFDNYRLFVWFIVL